MKGVDDAPYYVIPFGEQPAFHEAEDWIAETRGLVALDPTAPHVRRPSGHLPLGRHRPSAIVAMMSEHVDEPSIRTFSIAFESSFDESSYAERARASTHSTRSRPSRRTAWSTLPMRSPTWTSPSAT